jgi:hypothetical protein
MAQERQVSYAAQLGALAAQEAEDAVYRQFADAFHLDAPGDSPPTRPYGFDAESERLYVSWAVHAGLRSEAGGDEELERLLADPTGAACHDFLTTGRGWP